MSYRWTRVQQPRWSNNGKKSKQIGFGRDFLVDEGKYTKPHQGRREMARRMRQRNKQ